jgi:hypothetical protein
MHRRIARIAARTNSRPLAPGRDDEAELAMEFYGTVRRILIVVNKSESA